MGGLYSVTAWRENSQERVTVYTKHRLKLHAQMARKQQRPEELRHPLVNGGRVGEVVLHVGGNAVASEGVLRHVYPLGDSDI